MRPYFIRLAWLGTLASCASFGSEGSHNFPTAQVDRKVELEAAYDDMPFFRDFYATFDEASKKSLASWDFSSTPCAKIKSSRESSGYCDGDESTWVGVCCDKGVVTDILLSNKKLVGTIPTTVAALKELVLLDLDVNKFEGSLPSELGRLIRLECLYLGGNRFDGTLPTELSELKHLRELGFESNILSGTIPSELTSLTNLEKLEIQMNKFEGQVPFGLVNLPRLVYLDLGDNSLSGSFPACNSISLAFLRLTNNKLEGLLPSFTTLPLTKLALTMNRFTGRLGSLPKTLETLYARDNFFSSLDLSENTCLMFAQLQENNLQGELDFGKLPVSLKLLNVSDNTLSGTLSSGISKMANLVGFSAVKNHLVGSIPSEIGSLTRLNHFDVSQNSLIGTIPDTLASLIALSIFNVSSNRLTGTVPWSLFENKGESLALVDLSCNTLTGPLPSSLSSVAALDYLMLQRNQLTQFPVLPLQSRPIFVDLSFNKFSGALPSSLFSPRLQVLVAAENCFDQPGGLTEDVCQSVNLTTLVLDGMTLACPKTSTLGIRKYNRVGGVPPACLFALPNLMTCHLSGIGLQGTVDNIVVLAPSLKDLSLSHNRLSGPIPLSFLRNAGQFKALDLSFNRFNGELTQIVAPAAQSKISLDSNRLSGNVPHTLLSGQEQLSILEGNMFDCSYFNWYKELPSQDPYLLRFQCGSVAFDKYFYSLVVVSVLLPIFLQGYRVYKGKSGEAGWLQNPLTWLLLSPPPHLPVEIGGVLVRLKHLRCVTLLISGLLLFVLTPMYAASLPFLTQTQVYTFVLSASFKGGVGPSAFYLVVWSLLLVTFSFFFQAFLGHDLRAGTGISQASLTTPLRRTKTVSHWRVVFFFMINTVIVAASNVALIFSSQSTNVAGQTTAKIFFALFKFFYTKELSRHLAGTRFKGKASFEAFLCVTNLVAIPCIVTALQATECFYFSLLQDPPEVVSTFVQPSDQIKLSWDANQTDVLIIAPAPALIRSIALSIPFIYNYECTSSLLQIYAPIHVLTSLLCVVEFVFQNLLLVIASKLGRYPTLRSFVLIPVPKLLAKRPQRLQKYKLGACPSDTVKDHTVVDLEDFYFRTLSDYVVMFSFGFVFPFLTAASATCIVVRAIRKHKLLLQTWEEMEQLKQKSQQKLHAIGGEEEEEEEGTRDKIIPESILQGEVDAMVSECAEFAGDAPSPIQNASVSLLLFSSVFLAPFLQDTVGEVVGGKAAIWSPVVMLVLPAALLLAIHRLVPRQTIVKAIQGAQARLLDTPLQQSAVELEEMRRSSGVNPMVSEHGLAFANDGKLLSDQNHARTLSMFKPADPGALLASPPQRLSHSAAAAKCDYSQ